jgi:hypothetical protein
MAVFPDLTIPAFRRHVTVFLNEQVQTGLAMVRIFWMISDVVKVGKILRYLSNTKTHENECFATVLSTYSLVTVQTFSRTYNIHVYMENQIIITAWKPCVRYSDKTTCDLVHIPIAFPQMTVSCGLLHTYISFAVAEKTNFCFYALFFFFFFFFVFRPFYAAFRSTQMAPSLTKTHLLAR